MTDKAVINLDRTITLTNLEVVYTQFVAALDTSSTIEINAKAVDKIDTAGIQLLCLVRKEIDSQVGEVYWVEPSDSLIRSAELLGVKEELHL